MSIKIVTTKRTIAEHNAFSLAAGYALINRDSEEYEKDDYIDFYEEEYYQSCYEQEYLDWYYDQPEHNPYTWEDEEEEYLLDKKQRYNECAATLVELIGGDQQLAIDSVLNLTLEEILIKLGQR